jgi:outer membrane protein TolC
MITLADALQRAKANEPAFLTAAADAASAREDAVQARAGLLPTFSYSAQDIGNQPSPGLKTGRFVSRQQHVCRSWLIAHEDLSTSTLMGAPIRRARAAEAAALAKLEIAQRLVVTVTRAYLRVHHRAAEVRERRRPRSRRSGSSTSRSGRNASGRSRAAARRQGRDFSSPAAAGVR